MFTKLAQLLPKHLQRLVLTEVVQAAQVVDYFPEALKLSGLGNFNEHTQALHLKDGFLTIKVSSNSAAQNLQMNKLNLLDAYRKQFPNNPVRDLRFRVNK